MQHPILDLIARSRRFVLTGHENPDGDCLGAQAALYHLLRALGKDVVVLNPDPLTHSYDFLARHTPFTSVRTGAPVPPMDVLVLLDCHELSRVGSLGDRFRIMQPKIAVIDHHLGSDAGDGTVNFVDPTAAATGALVRELWRMHDLPLTAPAAEGVFLSLVADTGWFRYSNTDSGVLRMAAEMIDAGVRPAEFYDRIFRRHQAESVGLLARTLTTHQIRLDGRYAYAVVDRPTMDLASRIDFDTDTIMEPLRSLESVEVVALLKERANQIVKLSLRARGDVDVQRIAATFGGGGHRKAAGATMNMPLTEAIAAVESRVRAALEAPRTDAPS